MPRNRISLRFEVKKKKKKRSLALIATSNGTRQIRFRGFRALFIYLEFSFSFVLSAKFRLRSEKKRSIIPHDSRESGVNVNTSLRGCEEWGVTT